MPADLARLRDLLAEWEQYWHRLSMPVAQTAAPPATNEDIAEAEAMVGLTLPAEAREWFKWHNGTSDVPWAGYAAAPGWRLASVKQAAEAYLEGRGILHLPGEEEFFPRPYFPLAMGGGHMVVDTSAAFDEPAAVDFVNPHHGLPEWPLNPPFGSVADAVENLVDLFRQGWVEVDESGEPVLRFDEIPPARRRGIY